MDIVNEGPKQNKLFPPVAGQHLPEILLHDWHPNWHATGRPGWYDAYVFTVEIPGLGIRIPGFRYLRNTVGCYRVALPTVRKHVGANCKTWQTVVELTGAAGARFRKVVEDACEKQMGGGEWTAPDYGSRSADGRKGGEDL